MSEEGTGRGKVTIPADLDAAVKALRGLGRLLTAKEWERAAIVYAFTTEAEGPGKPKVNSDLCSPDEFAAKGITGLQSKNTVRVYRQAWQAAIDAGKAVAVGPGDEIELPKMTWPPTGNTSGSAKKQVEALADKPDQQLAKVLDITKSLSPQQRAAMVQRVVKNRDVKKAMDQSQEPELTEEEEQDAARMGRDMRRNEQEAEAAAPEPGGRQALADLVSLNKRSDQLLAKYMGRVEFDETTLALFRNEAEVLRGQADAWSRLPESPESIDDEFQQIRGQQP